MSAVIEAREPSSPYFFAGPPTLLKGFELFTAASGGVTKLRGLILAFAIQGRLVEQDEFDEPAFLLVQRAIAEKVQAAGKRLTRTTTKRDPNLLTLPENWCWSSLAEIGLINPRNESADDTLATFVQMSSVPIAIMERHKKESRLWRDIKSGFTHFAEGDVGLAKITPCFENGKSTVFRELANGIGAGTTELHIVRPLGGILPEYILIFLKSSGFLRKGEMMMTGSAGQKRVPRNYFDSTPFPLPPLAEQHRIVTRVEELMKLCDALEKNGRLADEQHARLTSTLFDALVASDSTQAVAENWQRVAENFDVLLDRPESINALEIAILRLAVCGRLVTQLADDESVEILLERIANGRSLAPGKLGEINEDSITDSMFDIPRSWTWARFDDVAKIASNLVQPAFHQSAWQIAPDCIEKGTGRLLSRRTVRESEVTSANHLFFPGQILYSKIRPSLSKAVIVDFSGLCSADMYPIEARIDTQFLLLVMLSQIFLDQVRQAENRVKMPKLNQESLNGFRIPLPPLAEQHRIVARVKELRQLCADLRQRLIEARQTQSRLADALVAEIA
jgi:type I restriction enzyme S subunit